MKTIQKYIHLTDRAPLRLDMTFPSYITVHIHDNDKSDDQHLLPFDGTIDWNNVLAKLKENNYNGPITLELAYKQDYLKYSINDFYKEAFNRALKLEEIYKKI